MVFCLLQHHATMTPYCYYYDRCLLLRTAAIADIYCRCEWSDEKLSLQCFGFGDAKLNSSGGNSVSASECEKSCCNSDTCDMWQQHNDRGCFFSKTRMNKKKTKIINGITCSKELIVYTGGRKCLQGYCGGLEGKILPTYEKNRLQQQMLKSLCKGGDCLVKKIE